MPVPEGVSSDLPAAQKPGFLRKERRETLNLWLRNPVSNTNSKRWGYRWIAAERANNRSPLQRSVNCIERIGISPCWVVFYFPAISLCDRPTIKSDRPTIHCDRPTIQSDRPTIQCDHPTIQCDRPTIQFDRSTFNFAFLILHF